MKLLKEVLVKLILIQRKEPPIFSINNYANLILSVKIRSDKNYKGKSMKSCILNKA